MLEKVCIFFILFKKSVDCSTIQKFIQMDSLLNVLQLILNEDFNRFTFHNRQRITSLGSKKRSVSFKHA